MKNIDISVIIPVYRAERTLGECIDSILSQKIDNMEIICVDDGSDDRSPEILKEYAERDARIILLSQKNQYAGVARNRGLEISRGEYVTFIDADDFLLPEALSKMLDIARENNLDFLKTGFTYLDAPTGERYRTLYSMNSSVEFLHRGRVLNFSKIPLRLLNVADVPWNAVYKRDFLEKNSIRFNNLQCVNDHSFYIHCLLCAERIMVVDFPAVCYRVEQASSLTGGKAKKFENQIASYYLVREIVKSKDESVRRMIMQRELYSTFGWYSRFSDGDNSAAEEQMREFLLNFDERDVGEEFLKSFAYCELYYKLKYGTEISHKQSKIKKALDCYAEHGLRYTLERLLKKDRRYKR